MKRLKIGFLAVIAIAAMSFTVVDYSKVFSKKVDPTYCFLPSTNSTGKKITPTQCNLFVAPFTPITALNCAAAVSAFNPAGSLAFKIRQLDQVGALTPEQQDEECPVTDGQFCCFNVQADPNPCSTTVQPDINIGGTSDQWIVSSVRCKVQ